MLTFSNSLLPVLLSHFLLNLRRCAGERRARASEALQLSTAISTSIRQSTILDDLGSDLAAGDHAPAGESFDEDGESLLRRTTLDT